MSNHITFTITEQMIRTGADCDNQHCPGALSMEAAGVWCPSVHYSIISGSIEGVYYQAPTPDTLILFMTQFDDAVGRDELLARPRGSIEVIVWETSQEAFLNKFQCVKGCMRWFDVSLAGIRAARDGGRGVECFHCQEINPVLPWKGGSRGDRR